MMTGRDDNGTDVQRAALYWMLQRNQYGALPKLGDIGRTRQADHGLDHLSARIINSLLMQIYDWVGRPMGPDAAGLKLWLRYDIGRPLNDERPTP